MSLLRRRREGAQQADAIEVDPLDEPTVEAGQPQRSSADNFERSLQSIAQRIDECVKRLDDFEARLGELAEGVANAPSHSDVLEVRLHSAKLAAELARATVELRGEIGMANDEARRAARLASSTDNATGEVPVVLPVDVDLSDIAPLENKKKRDSKGRFSESA